MTRFTLNGRAVQMALPSGEPLLQVLANDLGADGPKYGCGKAQCGSCTVLMDGAPVRSCLMFAVQAQGRKLRTVEGLAASPGNGGKLHALQQAFIDNHALQCGFCTSGFLMLAAGTLEQQPDIDDESLREVLSSNLCRCTGYQNILRAVRQVRDAGNGGAR